MSDPQTEEQKVSRGDLGITLLCFVPPAVMVAWLIGYALWRWLAA